MKTKLSDYHTYYEKEYAIVEFFRSVRRFLNKFKGEF